MKFQDLDLHASLLFNIEKTGFTEATPVQAQSIPHVLEGKDVMACAQTGTGKTAAFVLPAMHRLLTTEPKGYGKGPRVLILTPTRELATQVMSNINTFIKGTKLKSGVVMGGVAYGPQIKQLKAGVDVLVATPGRLIDHMQSKNVRLDRVEVVVLDEADRMLDMGFLKPMEQVFESIPQKQQTLLFSATFDAAIEKIAAKMLNEPARVHLAPVTESHDNIEQIAYKADDAPHKLAMLKDALDQDDVWQAIVFTATKRGADRLAEKIAKLGHSCDALHGDMKQGARKRVLQKMHQGDLKVLVATDVAARGLDVKKLSHVFNYDLPQQAEDYVHRIGRTGRGGDSGVAISLVSPHDGACLRDIQKLLKKSIALMPYPGLEPRLSDSQFEGQAKASKKLGRGGRGGNGGGGRGRGRSAGGKSVTGFKKPSSHRKGEGRSEGGEGRSRKFSKGKSENHGSLPRGVKERSASSRNGSGKRKVSPAGDAGFKRKSKGSARKVNHSS